MELCNLWYNFFHGRVGEGAFRLGGYLRIGFGILFLVDRFILGLDLDKFFSPTHGFIPMEVGRESSHFDGTMRSLLELYPESDQFMWTLFWIGIVQGFLLVVGIYPRVQLACLFVNIISFQNHNMLFWNNQDVLFRLWCFFLFFLPLHRITLFDLLHSTNKKDPSRSQKITTKEETWPLWPFRLFQIQLAIMYMGLSMNKLEREEWRSGEALFWIKDLSYFQGGWVEFPDIILNRMPALQLLTWMTLGLELVCWITMWIPALKRPTAFCMIAFNVVVDLTMNFHCLPWLAILGWCATLFEVKREDACLHLHHHQAQLSTSKASSYQSIELLLVTNLFVAILIALLCIDALPIPSIERMLGTESYVMMSHEVLYESIQPALCFFGLWQHVWNLYGGPAMPEYREISFSAILYQDNGAFGEPDVETEVWESPRFDEMAWLERKRHGRQVIYWSNLDDRRESDAWYSLLSRLADSSSEKDGGQSRTVVKAELRAHWRETGHPAASRWDWSNPATDESSAYDVWTSLLKNKFCIDVVPFDSSPSQYRGRGGEEFCNDCVSQPNFVERYCRSTCEVCVHDEAEYGFDVSFV